jgi:hypothetical protein
MLRRVALVRTDVSEELSASIIKLTRIGELSPILVTLMMLGLKDNFTFCVSVEVCMGKVYIRGAIQKFPKYVNKNYYVLPGSFCAPSP